MKEVNYRQRLLSVIPGGAHTYSRGFDQFPANAPDILVRGKGAYVYDPDGRRYLDYGMALRAVVLGYAFPVVNRLAIEAIKKGNNLTRPSLVELEAAELFVKTIPSADMVKFAKNGSNVTTAAVKLARAYTGRDLIARCADHPFFSFDDWFIGSTVIDKGIPQPIKSLTKTFRYGDIEDLERLFREYPNQIACVIMEPATVAHPPAGYLKKVKELTRENGAVLIFDEMITGFRWHLKGAQHYYGVEPDLCTFGKAMANGFSVAALGGKREIMRLGSIEEEGMERLFLLSTTHGAEMSSLAAFIATVRFMQEEDVIGHIWGYGKRLIAGLNAIAKEYGIGDYFMAGGVECSPWYITYNKDKNVSLPLRTLFMQEMLKKGVFLSWVALSYSHRDKELEKTLKAARHALKVYARALEDGVDKYLEGTAIRPVFRKFN